MALKRYVNGQYVEVAEDTTPSTEKMLNEYWRGDYDSLVEEQIRLRYSLGQELSILRQRYSNPDAFAAYDKYCEECKAYVKTQQSRYCK